MAKSSSLPMTTGKHLAFLRQEHGVKFAQDHLQEKVKMTSSSSSSNSSNAHPKIHFLLISRHHIRLVQMC